MSETPLPRGPQLLGSMSPLGQGKAGHFDGQPRQSESKGKGVAPQREADMLLPEEVRDWAADATEDHRGAGIRPWLPTARPQDPPSCPPSHHRIPPVWLQLVCDGTSAGPATSSTKTSKTHPSLGTTVPVWEGALGREA